MSQQNPVFIPGPTNIPEALRKACDMPTMDHRSSAFKDILHPARDVVAQVLRSATAEVFIFPATGTGGWEAAIANTLSAGDGIGIIGSTGRSTGPHLHFEVRFLGVPINPDLVHADTLTLIKDRYDYGV